MEEICNEDTINTIVDGKQTYHEYNYLLVKLRMDEWQCKWGKRRFGVTVGMEVDKQNI